MQAKKRPDEVTPNTQTAWYVDRGTNTQGSGITGINSERCREATANNVRPTTRDAKNIVFGGASWVGLPWKALKWQGAGAGAERWNEISSTAIQTSKCYLMAVRDIASIHVISFQQSQLKSRRKRSELGVDETAPCGCELVDQMSKVDFASLLMF